MSLLLRLSGCVCVVLWLTACSSPATRMKHAAAVSHVDRLEPLQTKAQLSGYLARLERAKSRRYEALQMASGDDNDELDQMVVTGTRVAAADVITNNQEAGIDEGDFVKKNGRWLIVLHNSHLHVLDTGTAAQPDLKLKSSLRLGTGDRDDGIWYDELLAYGEGQLLVLGFNYGEDMAELGFFQIDPATGGIQRGARYGLRSGDYFSDENYGARLHDGALQIQLNTELSTDDEDWPAMQRMDQPGSTWLPLAQVDDLYLPLIPTSDLQVHWVLRCPLDTATHSLQACSARGVVGTDSAQHYVSASATYLAMGDWDPAAWRQPGLTDSPDELAWERPQVFEPFRRTIVYRIPHDPRAAPMAARFRGRVENQFAFSEQDGQLWVGTTVRSADVPDGIPHTRYQLQHLALRAFDASGDALARVSLELDFPLDSDIETRYAAGLAWLAVQDSDTERSSAWRLGLERPVAQHLNLEDDAHRIEPLPTGALLFGSNDDESAHFTLSLLNAQGPLALLDRVALADRVVEDDRSHAFAWRPLPAGGLVAGLPVTHGNGNPWDQDWPAGAQWLWIRDGRMQLAPVLDMQGPSCDDCDDWYGEARVFFPGERMFALSDRLLREVVRDGHAVRVVREVLLPLKP